MEHERFKRGSGWNTQKELALYIPMGLTAVPDNNDFCSFILRDAMSAVAPPFPFWGAVSKAANWPVPGFVSALYWLDQPRTFCKFGNINL